MTEHCCCCWPTPAACRCAGGRKLTSTAAFAAMRGAVKAAQQQVLRADGTLTTLVGAVVCPRRWGGGHVLLAVGIGDSPCYVWRAATGTVEEVTHVPPLHGFHRWEGSGQHWVVVRLTIGLCCAGREGLVAGCVLGSTPGASTATTLLVSC